MKPPKRKDKCLGCEKTIILTRRHNKCKHCGLSTEYIKLSKKHKEFLDSL